MSRLIKDALRESISRDPRSYQRDLRNEITRLSERRRGFIIDCRLGISFSQAFPRLDDRDETRLTVNQSFLRRPEANSQSPCYFKQLPSRPFIDCSRLCTFHDFLQLIFLSDSLVYVNSRERLFRENPPRCLSIAPKRIPREFDAKIEGKTFVRGQSPNDATMARHSSPRTRTLFGSFSVKTLVDCVFPYYLQIRFDKSSADSLVWLDP